MNRQDLEFDSGGDACAAWLYRASDGPQGTPIVVMAHGLSGTRRDGLGPFAERFAAAGVAALVFDHRGFGDSAGEPDLFHPARQLEDWRATIAFARSLPGIDARRLVCVGEADQVAKPGPAIAAARRAPLGELRVYPNVDHFDIYDGLEHEAIVADQIDFLRRHLLSDQAG